MSLTVGETVAAGRYTIQALLGTGGMAEVYRVRHSQLGTDLALKVLSSNSPSQRERLMREGRAQASLRHSRIVSVVDVVLLGDRPGLIMEYIDGPSLDLVVDVMSLSLEQVDDLARQVMSGIAAAHEQGFVHRDLKPANILVSEERRSVIARVADFGLVKHSGSTNMTRSGAVMGTPMYMSPEQIRDSANVDARTDVFALGAVLYELLVGQRAFEGGDMYDVFTRIVAGDYPRIDGLRPDVPERMRKTIERALQPDASERFADANAMEEAWLADAPGLVNKRVWSVADLAQLRMATPTPPALLEAVDGASWDPDSIGEDGIGPTLDPFRPEKGASQPTIDPTLSILEPAPSGKTDDTFAWPPPAAPEVSDSSVAWPPPASRSRVPLMVVGLLGLGAAGAGVVGVAMTVGGDNTVQAEPVPTPVVAEPIAATGSGAAPEPVAAPEPEPVDVAPVAVEPTPPPAAPASITTPRPEPVPRPAPVAQPEPEPVVPLSVTIQSEPYSTIFVDGRSLGIAPQTTSLAPGAYMLRLEPASGDPHTQSLTVQADGQFFCWSFTHDRICR